MFEIIETANGWILQPKYMGGGYCQDYASVHVFNDVDDLANYLKNTLRVLSEQKDKD